MGGFLGPRGCAKFAPFWMKKINIGTPHVIKSPFLWKVGKVVREGR